MIVSQEAEFVWEGPSRWAGARNSHVTLPQDFFYPPAGLGAFSIQNKIAASVHFPDWFGKTIHVLYGNLQTFAAHPGVTGVRPCLNRGLGMNHKLDIIDGFIMLFVFVLVARVSLLLLWVSSLPKNQH